MKNKSLEALDRLGAEKLARGELIRNDSKVEPYINCIKQDLEAYEQLKQDHDKTLINNGDLCVKVADLQKENQELKHKLGKVLDSIIHYEYTKERCKREKLEKVIKILKDKTTIGVYEFRNELSVYSETGGNSITREEYELLKEVLE